MEIINYKKQADFFTSKFVYEEIWKVVHNEHLYFDFEEQKSKEEYDTAFEKLCSSFSPSKALMVRDCLNKRKQQRLSCGHPMTEYEFYVVIPGYKRIGVRLAEIIG